jgi:hypothetical protein
MNCNRPAIRTLLAAAILGAGQSSAADTTDAFFPRLIAIGELDGAALEYERLMFLGHADTVNLSCRLGEAQLAGGASEKAEALFERAVELAGDPPQKALAEYGLLRAYLSRRKSALARSEIDGLDSATRVVMGNETETYFAGLVHASAYRVDSARSVLSRVPADSRYGQNAAGVDTLLTWYRSQDMKNPLYAFIYSSAIPGWGHWYVGDRKKAAASFGLMAGLSGLLCYEGYRFYRGDARERYVRSMDMFLVWGLVWRRYYNGIRKAAHQRAAEKNRNIQLEYQERFRRILAEE